MSDVSAVLSLPYIAPAQAQKHVTHNEALRRLDVIVQLAVASRQLHTPPPTAQTGDRFIVAVPGLADWAGQGGDIAILEETGWRFETPLAGWLAWVGEAEELVVFDGAAWQPVQRAAVDFQNLEGIGVNAASDPVNRLAVASEASLFNHDGAGHRMVLNKAAFGETASLVFQSGFTGHAEMGLAGSEDFSLKVSLDGLTWTPAMEIGRSSGNVTFGADVGVVGTLDCGGLNVVRGVSETMLTTLDNTHPTAGSNAIQYRFGGVRRFTLGANHVAEKFAITSYDAAGNLKGSPVVIEYAQSANVSNALYIDANRNVGIGKAPQAQLDVLGAMRLDPLAKASLPAPGTIGAGGLAYVTDAAGGAQPAYCDGTAWLKMRDGLPV